MTDYQNSQETQPDITPTLEQVKIFFQNTGTPDSDWSRTGHLGRESCTATTKSLWKLLTLVLWVQDNFAELVTALKHLKPHNMLCQTPTHLDHRTSVKIDINKTYFSTGKTRYNGQIGTQQRLQINLFKTTTTNGHQILQSITEPKYSNHKSKKDHDQQFCPYLFFFPETGPRLIFLGL